MIKVIITGSNGLLGQSLLNLLLQNSAAYQVIGLSRGINKSGRNDFEYVSMDLTNSKLLETHLLNLQHIITSHYYVQTVPVWMVKELRV